MNGPGHSHESHASGAKALPDMPDHPLRNLMQENRAFASILTEKIRPRLSALKASGRPDLMPWHETVAALREDLETLQQIHLHYLKKENLLFPALERGGITTPLKGMRDADEEIRAKLMRARDALVDEETPVAAVILEDTLVQIEDMIKQEENILFPLCLETLEDVDWHLFEQKSGTIGWPLSPPPLSTAARGFSADVDTGLYAHHGRNSDNETPEQPAGGFIPGDSANIILPTGMLKLPELIGMLDALPFEILFLDKNDRVKYYSQGRDRIFAHTQAIIGRTFPTCDPPIGMKRMEELLLDFKTARKDTVAFRLMLGDKYILLNYRAIRDASGEYTGALEMVQDIGPIPGGATDVDR